MQQNNNNNNTTHPHRLTSVRSVPSEPLQQRVCSALLCLAVPPLAGSSVWPVEEEEEEEEVQGGYAPTCVRLVNWCRRRQLDGAQRRRPAARCTRGWCRWEVTGAASCLSACLSACLSVCLPVCLKHKQPLSHYLFLSPMSFCIWINK